MKATEAEIYRYRYEKALFELELKLGIQYNNQKQLLNKIETRSCGSLRNDITILDSHQDSVCTPYTSIILTDGAKFATVKYKDHFDERPKS